MISTSGLVSPASLTVSLPSAASAQTSQPGTPSINVRSPLRTTAWSSASMTRFTLGRLLVLETIIRIPLISIRNCPHQAGSSNRVGTLDDAENCPRSFGDGSTPRATQCGKAASGGDYAGLYSDFLTPQKRSPDQGVEILRS